MNTSIKDDVKLIEMKRLQHTLVLEIKLMLETAAPFDNMVRVDRQTSHNEGEYPRPNVPLPEPCPSPENTEDHQDRPTAACHSFTFTG